MTKGECNKIGHKKRPAENYLRLSLALKAKNGKHVNLLTLKTIQSYPGECFFPFGYLNNSFNSIRRLLSKHDICEYINK